jgi:dipeptidase D
MDSISQLKPKELWRRFHELSLIPRPSKKEGKAADFVARFGNSLGLKTIKDETGNVIIQKPATPGQEHKPGIILQTHLDMVPQKNSDKIHDFENDPISLLLDGEWMTADGTTLGADNGIGVAATMAILESNTLKHGPLEALFTVDEETGMTGAKHLKPGILKGSILINLDSEDEGELYVGCAGGLDGTFRFEYSDEPAPAATEPCRLSVTGLKGGHSGMDINLGRGNANKIIFRILRSLDSDIRLSSISGGSARNAIPREAFADLFVPSNSIATVAALVGETERTVKAELKGCEPDLKIRFERIEAATSTVIPASVHNKLVNAVCASPDGVLRMSDAMPDLVETSTNLAIVKSEKGATTVSCLMRSSVNSAKEIPAMMLEAVFTLAGATVTFSGDYPGWNPDPDSKILLKMKAVYEKLYGREPAVKAIHAGLECGLLGGIYPELDMISCGPTIRYPHSPDEKVHTGSVEKWWNFLTAVLES